MSFDCAVCNEEIEDDADKLECDGCILKYHYICGGVTKKEVAQRKSSKSLRQYCAKCIASPTIAVMDNIKIILQFVHKLDLYNQQQVEKNEKFDRLISSTSSKVIEIGEKLDAIAEGQTSQTSSDTFDNINKKLDAIVVGKSNAEKSSKSADSKSKPKINPVVVVKPKNKQTSKKTMEVIKNTVGRKAVKVCSSKGIRDGGIVISCENDNDTMKVKQLVEKACGKSYDVHLPEIKKPRLRITNVSANIDEKKLISEIKKVNSDLKNDDLQLIAVIEKNKHSYSYRDLIVEVNGTTYNKMIKMGKLFLDWRECRVTEHLYLQRCYKCCGFSHIAKNCKLSQKCSKCAGAHKFQDCKRKVLKCVNCCNVKEKYGADIDDRHHAWSNSCMVYQRKLESMKNKIEYSDEK